jgi:colanic acid biosynthesis glycosyl transferase WcaI
MHIVLVNQFYPPDVAPTGRMLHDVAETLTAKGNDVTVLCSRHAYTGDTVYPRQQELDGVNIVRIATPGAGRHNTLARLFSAVCFYLGVFFRLLTLRSKPDLMLALTTPPWIGVLIRCVSTLRRIPHAHWVMDIYPAVMAAHGMVRTSSLAYRLLTGLSRFQFSEAAFILTLGDDMASLLQPLTEKAGSNLAVCPLWAAPDLRPWSESTDPPSRSTYGQPNDLILLYSGNMGLAHRFDDFLAAAAELTTAPEEIADGAVRLVFSGGGARTGKINAFIQEHPEAHVSVHPYVEQEALREHLCSADVLLVSLDPAWQGMLIPSKVQAAFAVGKPVLFVGGSDNSIAHWITESGAGWCVAPDNVDSLLTAIKEARDGDTRETMGRAATQFADMHFVREKNCAKICEMISMATGHSRTTP